MRLLDFGQKPDYVPLERGSAFPQYHEDGDKFKWWNPMDFSYRFWHDSRWLGVTELMHRDRAIELCMMGGEL